MAMKKKAKRLTEAEQSARFIETAKKAEADESGASFERAIRHIVSRGKRDRRSKPTS